MKKISLSKLLITSLCALMVFTVGIGANAATSTSGGNVSVISNQRKIDIAEIETLCKKDAFMETVEMVLGEQGITFDDNISLDWSDLIIVYSEEELFSLNTTDKSAITAELESGDYCYVTSAFYDDIEIEITFSKGREAKEGIEEVLTTEQYQNVVENVGKWFVSSVGIINDDEVSIYGSLKSTDLTKYDEMLIVSSVEGLYYPIVLGFEDDVVRDIITIYDEKAYPLLDNLKNNSADANIYTFSQIKSAAETYVTGVSPSQTYFDIETSEGNILSTRATGNYKFLSVTKYAQEKSNWCWAACAKMLGKYYTGVAMSQSDIVTYVQGSSSGNNLATGNDTKKALTYATSRVVTFTGVQSYSAIENRIYVGEKPFCINVIKSNGIGHLHVVNGINGLPASEQINLIDPSPNNGSKWYQYTALVNGTEFPFGTGTYEESYLIN